MHTLRSAPLPQPLFHTPAPWALAGLLFLAACGPSDTPSTGTAPRPAGPLFLSLAPDSTGITFANTLEESPSMNYFTYIYAYNGGGVGAGDINGDGLIDLFFSGNQQRDRLYLNLGGMRFEDITEKALGPDPGGWRTGVAMADVNGDGHLDIYVCRSGLTTDTALTRNLLYLNNGDLTFREAAHALGVADTSHSTQATFLDVEGDGDLDLYVINHPMDRISGVSVSQVRAAIAAGTAPSNRLFVQDNGRFREATRAHGLMDFSYSLGVNAVHLDGDDRIDLYVANDFDVSDAMYTNHDGQFTEVIKERTRHVSNFGMGCDVADLNNDALPDIVVLDMVADDHVRSKTNMGSMSAQAFWSIVAVGQHYQYMVNTLQLNNGNGTFSEIAQLAGIARTDWSWAPLLADLDNDGWKDLLVTNGYKHDIRNNDYQQQVYRGLRNGADFYRALDLVPSTRIRNYLFHNQGADSTGRARLTFADSSQAWGFTEPLNSNGAVYADLDNDGDLDLAINNIDAPASVYANRARDLHPERHYLRLALKHAGHDALGARVTLRHHGTVQYQELSPVRGYQSSVEPVLHFGLGPASGIDSLEVRWPDGRITLLRNVQVDRMLTLDSKDAAAPTMGTTTARPLLAEDPARIPDAATHRDPAYDDFRLEVLLPHKMSELGPMLAVADVNDDGRDDLWMGGGRGQAPMLMIQTEAGTLKVAEGAHPLTGKGQELLGARFIDGDGDGDQDLLVLAGSNEDDLRSDAFRHHYLRNDGTGRFTRVDDALPPMMTSGQRADAADIDGDGDLDLFVGGRQTPAHYPFAPRSYLLLNDGTGHFTDATEERARDLMGPGLVSDMRFADLDGDRDPDLVLVGEWMPVMVLLNDGGRFTDATRAAGLEGTSGWWNSLCAADLDGDGDVDLAAGNLGWNSKFKADAAHPLHVYWADMDDNGRSDIVLAKEKAGHQVPVRGRECSSQQCPVILQRFPTYDAFANADLQAIYTPGKLDKALHRSASWMRSAVFLNDGAGRFTARALPVEAQLGPVNGIAALDVNADGHMDLVTAGNNWGAEVETVRYDAGRGCVLLGDGRGGFTPLTPAASGFFAWGNARDLAVLRMGPRRTPVVVVAEHGGRPQAFVVGGLSATSAR
ncbi:MAG: VCBS repeat-containing protein [Flavobacteriales bacterium]|nr:hypothetical protein [Flavobacteriales bacterium]MCC6577949.1 VCBS repeat-containing protein [Flavobacteriales bacterium]NUQ14415.1 VCBS repeat-containing protein [Flavobacteriales bacterium]